MNGGILALDIASTTGWAEGLPGERPVSGSISFKGTQPERMGAMLAFLGARLSAFRYRLVIFEAPLDPRWMGKATNFNTSRLLLGLTGVAEAVTNQTGHTPREANVGDVRIHMLGCRPKAADAKAMVTAKARALGFDPRDDNEADALMLWHYARDVIAAK